MSEAPREKPYMKKASSALSWDWWGENPGEIVLVVFIIVLFGFIHSLPPQGWGIDDNPEAARASGDAPSEAVQRPTR